MSGDQADERQDSYSERVLRNEGRLDGLIDLIKERRIADQKALFDFTEYLKERLTSLNGEYQRINNILEQSVPREVWATDKKALDGDLQRIRDSVTVLEKTMLGVATNVDLTRLRTEITDQRDRAIQAATGVLDNRLKAVELQSKETSVVVTKSGILASGYGRLVGWAVAGVSMVVLVVTNWQNIGGK